jgi:protein-tyrosine-phosphatase
MINKDFRIVMATVLFVCVHNAARSQMAQAFFNKISGGRHESISAGSNPSDRVNPDAVRVMVELGIDLDDARPKKLTGEMIEQADLVVTMGCGEDVCPIVPTEVVDWDLEDPSGKSLKKIRSIRDEIHDKVRQLIVTLDMSEKIT